MDLAAALPVRVETSTENPMTDLGPELWARQKAQLTVINAIRPVVDDEPDRFAGITTDTSARATPREARGTPLIELVGQPAEPTAARLRDEGRDVEIHHLGHRIALTTDLRPNRVRLFVHDGLVRDASPG